MTTLKRLATMMAETLAHGFATASPFLGAPAYYRAFGPRGPLTDLSRLPRLNTARDLLASLADAYNRHDVEGIRARYAPDATVNDTTVDAALATHERFFTFLPDAKVDLLAAAAEGTTVIAELTLHGTNTGPMPLGPLHRAIAGTDAQVLPPTGRTVAVPVVLVSEHDGGRIVTERQHFDSLALLAQLGLLPAT